MPGSAESHPAAGRRAAPIVRVERVARAYGATTAVADVSFEVGAGEIVGLVGSDGAGKTTLLRMVAAMIAPDAGAITVCGCDTVRERAGVKRRLGYMPQRFALYADLTVLENLDFFLDVYGFSGAERRRRRERYLGFAGLAPFGERKAGDLSGGMKQKLGLACVLIHEPQVLILDEPTNGVDPVSRREFWRILAERRREGMTLLVATAYLDEGERCDRVLVMHKGRLLAAGTPAEVRAGERSLEEAMIAVIRRSDAALSEERFGA